MLLSISGGGPSMTYTDRYVRDMRPLVQVNIAFMCLVPVLSGGAPTVQHVCACIFILVPSTLYGTSLAWSICVRVCMLAWMHYCMRILRIATYFRPLCKNGLKRVTEMPNLSAVVS